MKWIKQLVKSYEKDDYLTYNMAKALVYISLIGLCLDIVYLAVNTWKQNITKDFSNFYIAPILFFIIFIITIILVKKHKLKLAGNFIFTGLTLTEIFFSIYSLISGSHYVFIYAGTNYFILMLLTFGFFYASNVILVINVTLIIITAIINFLLVKSQVTPDVYNHLLTATIDYVTDILALYVILYFSKKLIRTTIKLLLKERNEKVKQNITLSEVLNNLKKIIDELDNSSQSIVQFSVKLSRRAQEQAVSTEEVAASTEEISTTVNNTYTVAQNSLKISKNTLQDFIRVKRIFQETLEAFLEIINQLNTINQIAEKTDILAINAAIEAAHAREYGKGFSIVAQEIRKLSDTTKKTADNITELAQITREKAASTIKRFKILTANMEKSAAYMTEITNASQELLSAIEQISRAVTQLSNFAEENSYLAMELEVTSHNISRINGELNSIIQKK